MLDSIHNTLMALRDVNGIQGSFVVSSQGTLLARELPPIFDDSILAEAGPRIARLYETFLSNGDDMDVCSIRFAEYMLYLRNVTRGFLCVLTSVGVNMPALKMAVNLAHRRISQDLEGAAPLIAASAYEAPAQQFAPQSAPAAASQPAAHGQPSHPAFTQKRVRMYRGKIIED